MDLQLKQRLVGATVLVSLAVIIVPELLRPQAESAYGHLDGEVDADNLAPDQGQVRLSRESPDAPVTVTTRNLPRVNSGESVSLSLPPRSESALESVAEDPTPEPVAAKPAPNVEVAVVQTPAPASTPMPTPVSTPKPELPKLELVGRSGSNAEVPAVSGGWKVQVASLKDESNATRQQKKLEKAGLPADVRIVNVQGVPLYRVAIGPFADSTAARTAQEKAVSLGFKDAFLVSP